MLKLIAGAALALFGCTPIFTQTGPVEKPRPARCSFQLLTAPPGAPFTELGVVEVMRSYRARDLALLESEVQPYVCQAGGDAAIAQAGGESDSFGRAIVIKLGEAGGGCQHDTQCKGDRLCVQGRCQDPTPK